MADARPTAVLVDEFDAGRLQDALDYSVRPAGSTSFTIQMNSHLDRGFREPALGGGAARRIPGRSVGDRMNSMPAASNAAFISSSVDERLGGYRPPPRNV